MASGKNAPEVTRSTFTIDCPNNDDQAPADFTVKGTYPSHFGAPTEVEVTYLDFNNGQETFTGTLRDGNCWDASITNREETTNCGIYALLVDENGDPVDGVEPAGPVLISIDHDASDPCDPCS